MYLIHAGIFIVVTYFDRPSLYCTSRNLLESLVEIAPFCVISGTYKHIDIVVA